MNSTSVQLNRQLFTRDDYYKMAEVGILPAQGRVELIRGEIIQMSPSKSDHASTIDILAEELIYQLRGKAIIRIQNPLSLSHTSEPEPDLIIARFQLHRYQQAHPRPDDVYVCIEVADTSLAYDREIKTSLYAESGIPEYWLINLIDKQVEVYRNPEKGLYTSKEILFPKDNLSFDKLNWRMGLEVIF